MKIGRYTIGLNEGPVFENSTSPMLDLGVNLKQYRAGFDDPKIEALDKWLKNSGYKLTDVPQEELYRMFGPNNDPVAGREGKNIYVSLDHRGRKLRPVERRCGVYHELGHEDTDSETDAHLRGLEVAKRFGDTEAVEEMHRQLFNLQRYSLN